MKLINPLLYPLAALAGGIILIVGVRVIRLPSAIVLPATILVTGASASWLHSRQNLASSLKNPELAAELRTICDSARILAQQALALRQEATVLLADSAGIDLLGSIQYACDRTLELPAKIDQLALRLKGKDSLLSISDLQQQLSAVESKLQSSSDVAKEHLSQLAISLRRNLKLASQGQNSRQAQLISLTTSIQDAAGVLQELQNQLRSFELNDSSQATELRLQTQQLLSYQENIDLLISK